jgi:hypothetical protein
MLSPTPAIARIATLVASVRMNISPAHWRNGTSSSSTDQRYVECLFAQHVTPVPRTIRPADDQHHRHQDIDQHRGERRTDRVALDAFMKAPKMPGSRKRPSVSVIPTSNRPDEMRPAIEPIPPMTMTTKARISTGSPMPTCTDWIVPTRAPGEPGQRRAERENHRVEPADIDTERGDHLAVGLACPDTDAEPRPVRSEEQPDGHEDAR